MPQIEPPMARSNRRGTRAVITAAAALMALPACGAVIKFSDNTPIAVRVPAPGSEAPVAKRVEVKNDHIEITEKIQFDLDQATIKPESYALLDEIVQVLKDNPNITKVEIAGHTDDYGEESYNQALSERRAKAVLEYLTSHGIEASRLSYKGYGESKPIADNSTAAGKEKNRRVEFRILEQQLAKGGTP
jgi:outer membrane protein OmpA-like peptidoglycan-associated protein